MVKGSQEDRAYPGYSSFLKGGLVEIHSLHFSKDFFKGDEMASLLKAQLLVVPILRSAYAT